MAWGLLPVPYRVPAILDRHSSRSTAQLQRLPGLMLLISALMFVAIWLLLTRTASASSSRPPLRIPRWSARSYNVPRVFTIVFAGGSAWPGSPG